MRDKEIKILWGRSGNRCSICKIELTPDGSRETLGEMAHIVGHSPDGPRGAVELGNYELDSYVNLILLCPTHHVDVDKNPALWPVERLRSIKTEHEKWVSERLDSGQIAVQLVDNSAFIETRREAWTSIARGQVSVVVSLSPLRVSMETLQPLSAEIVNLLESARIPSGRERGAKVNSFRTRPNENGVVNEDLSNPANVFGHSIQVFRLGHCEYFCELGAAVKRITEYARESKQDLLGATYVVRYTDVAEAVEYGLSWLWEVWKSVLPYTYMTMTVRLINTDKTILYSREDSWSGGISGFPTAAKFLEYSDVVTRGSELKAMVFEALCRIANCYGLVLCGLRDQAGKYLRPERMSGGI